MTEADWFGKRWHKIVVPQGKFELTYAWCQNHDSPHEFVCEWYGHESRYYFESDADAVLFRLKFV